MTNPLHRRHQKEKTFRVLGALMLSVGILFLLVLIGSMVAQGWRTMLTASIDLAVYVDPAVVGEQGEANPLKYQKIIHRSLYQQFPAVQTRGDKKQLKQLLSFSAALQLHKAVTASPDKVGSTVSMAFNASSVASRYLKGGIDTTLPEQLRNITDKQIAWLEQLKQQDKVALSFNTGFFTNPDSRDAESAGIGVALMGSFYTILLALLISFPISVATAIYLEMFAPKNKWLDFIEININNLAAVPSVVFGLLGLAIFINFFGMPRSSSLVGGFVLSLMTLPTIIIAARAALKAVPPSYLSAALALGATKVQGVFHHVLPAAMPGILTGTIIGVAGTLGETAPLLMIGMVAFVSQMPEGITDAATVLPVQIFLWADSPERGFAERSAAAILVLLVFLLAINLFAIWLRNKFEKGKG